MRALLSRVAILFADMSFGEFESAQLDVLPSACVSRFLPIFYSISNETLKSLSCDEYSFVSFKNTTGAIPSEAVPGNTRWP